MVRERRSRAALHGAGARARRLRAGRARRLDGRSAARRWSVAGRGRSAARRIGACDALVPRQPPAGKIFIAWIAGSRGRAVVARHARLPVAGLSAAWPCPDALLSLNVAPRERRSTIDGREVMSAIGKRAVDGARAVLPLGIEGDEQADLRSTAARARPSTPTRASTTRSGRRCARRPASRLGRAAAAGLAGREPHPRRRRRERSLDRRRAALSGLRARGQRAALSLLQVQCRDGLQARRQADDRERLVRLRTWRCASPARSPPARASRSSPARARSASSSCSAPAWARWPRPRLDARVPPRVSRRQPRRRAEAHRADARAAPPGCQGQGLPLRRHPRRRGRLLAARPLRAEERRVRARHRPALDARRPARSRSPTTSRSCAASIPTACSRSTRDRRRSR